MSEMPYIQRDTPTSSGFTIVELLIVIVVIGILAAITIVSYSGVQRQAEISLLKNDASSARSQVELIVAQNSSPPDNGSLIKVSSRSTLNYQRSGNDYCITISSQATPSLSYFVKGSEGTIQEGSCVLLPNGYEEASIAAGQSGSVGGISAIQPSSCPSTGGSWIKVPGNTLYGLPNGFCVQQYPAANVSGVATSQPNVNRWSAITNSVAQTSAATAGSGAKLLTDAEWMTIAANAAMQPNNWSGGSVGSGTLPIGSVTATRGSLNVALSNGERIYFDTGQTSYYASREFTCYTGQDASSCGIQAQYQPAPAAAYYTDQMSSFTSFGSLTSSGGLFYGDPRYANASLNSFVTSSRNAGLGYLRTSYSASTSAYNFVRGAWIGANTGGLFSLDLSTAQNYAHATYGFRASYAP